MSAFGQRVRPVLPVLPLLLFSAALYWWLRRTPEELEAGLHPPRSVSTVDSDLEPGLVLVLREGRQQRWRVVPGPHFHLDAAESLHPALSPNFQAEWSGLLTVLEAGSYRFQTGEGVLRLGGRRVSQLPVELAPGRYPFHLSFRRNGGPAGLRLLWSSEHFPWEPIPASAFSHSGENGPPEEGARIEQGRLLVEELGCVNCHASSSPSLRGRKGPDLTHLGSRAHRRWIELWLEDPSALRPGAVMPSLLDARQSADVAAYLASLGGEEAQDRKEGVPSPGVVEEGRRLYYSIGCGACHEQESLTLEGLGSKHPPGALARYLLEPARFAPAGRMPSLGLTEAESRALAWFLTRSRDPRVDAHRPGAGDEKRGRRLVESQGCLACHTLDEAEPLQNRQKAPPLAELRPGAGCLAPEPPSGLPRYLLRSREREAIAAFLEDHARHPDRSPAPLYQLARTLEKLRCGACHLLPHGRGGGSRGGAPPLTAPGDKLRIEWMERVLQQGSRVRDWLDLRMPRYDPRQVSGLGVALAKAAGVSPSSQHESPVITTQQQARGVRFLGNNSARGGLACFRCHDWGSYRSLGEPGPQLLNVTERLRYDWYYRFMLNPGRLLSGTSMPDYFAETDDEESVEETIRSLWAALSLGERMPLPEGLDSLAESPADRRPSPGKDPILLRVYMPDATPAAIAVGLPGGISYCFDAGVGRLRYAWKGEFIDWKDFLSSKVDSQGFSPQARILGKIFYRSDQLPFRFEGQDSPPRVRFRGYRLDRGYPTFHYQLGPLEVFETIREQAGGLLRQFHFPRLPTPLLFLQEPVAGLSITSTLGPFENGVLRIPSGTDVRFEVAIRIQENAP